MEVMNQNVSLDVSTTPRSRILSQNDKFRMTAARVQKLASVGSECSSTVFLQGLKTIDQIVSYWERNIEVDAEEDKRHDLERNAAQSQEEFVLVPSGQENVFILKPIANSSPLVEDFDQDTTWGDENGFLPTEKNITDVSFDLEQIISEGIVKEGNLDKQTENTIQEIPDERHVQTENATTLEAEVHTKNTKNTTIQEILDENYVQTDNTPSQEIADDNYEPTDLEEVDSNAEKEHEMRGNETIKENANGIKNL
ncbi:hypothetical protein J6590_065579 [Homalodisca vitripennis]|nr:hypothetical protein J6590_065579 [Homalodisca vitripennis]